VTTPISRVGKQRNNQRGFTYVMVLVAVVALGIVLETATIQSSQVLKREQETELLFRGQAYRQAIARYYETRKVYPRSLKDLLNDPQSANKHYLRSLYPDPMSRGKTPWTLLRAPDGGIAGVASQRDEAPLKKANFPAGLEKFETAKTYAEWIFDFQPTATPALTPVSPSPLPLKE